MAAHAAGRAMDQELGSARGDTSARRRRRAGVLPTLALLLAVLRWSSCPLGSGYALVECTMCCAQIAPAARCVRSAGGLPPHGRRSRAGLESPSGSCPIICNVVTLAAGSQRR